MIPTARNVLTRPPLADIFHPPYPPIASQSISPDLPFVQARAFQFSRPLFRRMAKAALDYTHRTSTVSSCAFCEQGGHLAAPSLSFSSRALREHGDRPSYPTSFFSILLGLLRRRRRQYPRVSLGQLFPHHRRLVMLRHPK